MRSSKEKVIADCEWAINKILSQGSTTVTSMQFFKDVEYYLKHSTEIVPCKPRVSSVEQRCGNCNKVIEMDGWKACPWCGKPILWEAVGRSVK